MGNNIIISVVKFESKLFADMGASFPINPSAVGGRIFYVKYFRIVEAIQAFNLM